MTSLAALLDPERIPEAGEVVLERAEDEPRLAVLTLNRPHSHNSISLEMWRRIPLALAELEEPVAAVVLRGAGASALSVGADITEFPRVRMTPREALGYSAAIGAAIDAIRGRPYPVVAMIGGLAVGGGCELAAACNARIAASSARLGVPIGRLGVTLGPSEAAALAELIGASRTFHLVASGRLLGAEEALRIGLVDELVAPELLAPRVAEFARGLAAASSPTIRSLKRTLRSAARGARREEAEAFAAELFDVYAGEDLREGVAAFEQKRPPAFGEDGR